MASQNFVTRPGSQFVQSGTGAVERTVEDKLQDVVSVKDFGAAGDGATDDTPKFQAAIDYCEANGIGSLFIPFQRGEKYKLDSTVIITRGDFELFGTAANANTPQQNTGYIFSSVNGAVLFDYGNSQSTPTAAFTVKGINFYSTGTGAAQTAIKFTNSNNGPHRAMTFRDCSFRGFAKALHFDTPSGTLAPSFVDIQDCNFRNGDYSLVADDQVLGLRFVANQSEQGGRIKGNFSAWAYIAQNLIEGQNDFLDLGGTGSSSVTMADNYVEANNGSYLARISFSNTPATTLRIGYHYNFSGTRTDNYLVGSMSVVNESNLSSKDLITVSSNANLYPNSKGLGGGYRMVASAGDERAGSLLNAKELVGNFSPADLRAGGGGAVTVLAPHGIITTAQAFTTSGYSGYTSLAKSIAQGDIVVVSYLLRATTNTRPAGSASYISIQVLDQAYSGFRDLNVYGMWDGDSDFTAWRLATFSFVAPRAITTARARIQPYPALSGSAPAIQIGGVGMYTFTPTNTRPVIQPIYPVV